MSDAKQRAVRSNRTRRINFQEKDTEKTFSVEVTHGWTKTAYKTLKQNALC